MPSNLQKPFNVPLSSLDTRTFSLLFFYFILFYLFIFFFTSSLLCFCFLTGDYFALIFTYKSWSIYEKEKEKHTHTHTHTPPLPLTGILLEILLRAPQPCAQTFSCPEVLIPCFNESRDLDAQRPLSA